MNIQQVKGEVGDGEEDITAESLTKYEKAAEALGVSLKEVRNGAVSLRDPMVVLDELATAFNKEADDSIKKANLISAIGGKYRGNQLSALLSNWDTYKDILNTFNSEQAVGSAMTEAEKSANNWAGSLNKVRNSWAELVNQFINSDNAVSVIQSINRMIQSLTESAATGGLKTTANLLSDLVELISVFSEKVGTLPVLLAGIAGIGSFKGKGIFGTITEELDESVKHITIFKKQWADIKTDISNPNTKGLSKVGVALEGVKIKAIATEVAVSALNAALTLGLSLAVGLAVKGISKLVDNLVVTKEELAEMRQETLNDLDSLSDSITSLTEDSQTLQGLLSQYKQLSQSTQDISQNKEELLRIQDTLVEQFGDEANNLDLLNDKYDTTIDKIKDLSEAQQTEWRRQHAAEIKRAEDIASLDVNIGSGLTNPVATNRGFVDATNDLVKQLYVIDGLNREFTEYATSLDDVYYVYRSFWGKDDKIALTGTIEEAREQLGQLIDTYKNMDNVDQATLGALTTRYEELGRAIEDVNTYTEQNNLQNNIANVGNSIGNISKTALTSLSEIQTETDNIGNKWFENLDEAQKGSLKTINTVTSALQKIAGGDLLSGDEFWALAKIDTERVLDGAKLVGNQFKVSEEQLIQLKDTYIKKQIETIKAENADLAVKKQQTDELIRQAELEVQALGRRGLSNSAYRTEFEKANEQLRQSKQYSKEYGDSITRNNILIQQLNGSLGNTVDYQKALSDRQKKLNDEISRLNKEADNLLKAQEYVIDQRIKDHENEKKALENEKKLLEEQLDVLEQQQSELEDMIENYKSIAGVVEDELGKSIENLKKQQEAEENAVQAKIDALKESRERQDEENSLLEKELELKEKLANLDKAKSTKVRTFSSARGWHFDVDREAVANAEEEVRAAQKSYDDAVADKAYKDQEKALEQEKDVISKNYEAEIKAYEDYIQQYKDVLEEETIAENERLAEQILGADWREKISKRDVELLGKFKNEYRSHNNALKTLVNTELAMTKASIEAKDAEIKAKQEQIDAWNQYKTDVQQAAQDIKNANEDYMNYINSVVLPDEANNFVQREINLWNFKENYKAYMDEIASKQAELDSVADSLTNLQDIANGFDLGDLISNLERMTDQFGNALLTVDEFEKMWEDTYEKQKRMGMINSASAAYVMGSHSEGGVADYTGLAMLHGTKQKSETIFNANDSAKLYDLVHNTPNIMADMVSKAVKISRPTIANNSTTNNPIFNIQRMEINGVQNPKEFTEAFNKNIEAYWKTKLTENRVK